MDVVNSPAGANGSKSTSGLRRSLSLAHARVWTPSFQRLFKNAGKLQLNRLLSAAVSAAQIAVIARYLNPGDYGIYALVLNTTQVIQSVFDVRCGEMVIRYFFRYKKNNDLAKSTATLLVGGLFEVTASVAGAIVLFSFSGAFSSAFFHSTDHARLFGLAALIPLFNIGSGLAASILSIDRAYGRLALADSTSTIFGFVLVLATLPFHASLATLLFTGLATQAAKGSLRWAYLYRSSSETRSLFLAGLRNLRCIFLLRADAKEIISFAFSNNIAAFLKILQGSAPNFAIGLWQSPVQVAYYYLGQRIGLRLSALCTPVTDVTFREAAEDRKENRESRIKAVQHGAWIILATVLPVLIGLVALGHWTIPLIFGKGYQAGVLPVEITVATYAVALLFNPLGALLIVEGKINLINISFAAGLVTQLAAIFLLVPRFSSTGAAVALSAFYTITILFMVIAARPLLKTNAS